MYLKGKVDESCKEIMNETKESLEDNVIVKVKEDPPKLFGEQIKLQLKRYFETSIYFGFLYSIAFDDMTNMQIEDFTISIHSIMMAFLLVQLIIIYFNQYENKFAQMIGAIMGYIAGYFIFNETVHDLLKFEVVPFYKFSKTYFIIYIVFCLGFSLIYETGEKIQAKKKTLTDIEKGESFLK